MDAKSISLFTQVNKEGHPRRWLSLHLVKLSLKIGYLTVDLLYT
jgi:hypothetical protein